MSGFLPLEATTPAISDPNLEGPDFRHVTHWVFDLDNTLYRADNGIFARIDARMTEFVSGHFSLAHDEARALQKKLYREHGTTLNGLITLYGMDPEPYLEFVHKIDLSDLHPDPALGFAIERLPGKRYIFTNGCARHAARILARLELTHLFSDVWDIRTIGFAPKPDPEAYNHVLAHGGFAPGAAAMFDDIARNLVEARRLGMTTVWLDTGAVWDRQGPEFPLAAASHIDHVTKDLTQFLNRIRI
jgi:putative hydrolase of the HAD superfamily